MTSRELLEADWARVREFLVDVQARAAPGFVWEVRRWDGWRWYRADPRWDPARGEEARIWEDSSGSIVAAAFSESVGDVQLQVDPDHRGLEDDMLAWAEERLAATRTGERLLVTEVRDYDIYRLALVRRRGWRLTQGWGVTRWQHFGDAPFDVPPLAEGYGLAALRPGDACDHKRLATLLDAAFPRSRHTSAETMTFERFSPGFRPDLHLFAEAPDETFAAHVGLTLEPTNALVVVEPVCTHPEHRRRGLARGLLLAGLERARAAGALQACVDTGSDEHANRLYETCGFGDVYRACKWEWRS
jgi:mycothiol synthase